MIDVVILRATHIIFGMLWVGLSVAAVMIFHPLAAQVAPSEGKGNSWLMRWYAQSNFPRLMPIAAIVTTVAGLYITGRLFAVNGGTWLSNAGMWVLYFGMLFGLLAFGHGIGLGALTARYARASREVLAADGPTPEQGTSLVDLEGRINRSTRVSLVLTTIALLAMSAARYIPAVG